MFLWVLCWDTLARVDIIIIFIWNFNCAQVALFVIQKYKCWKRRERFENGKLFEYNSFIHFAYDRIWRELRIKTIVGNRNSNSHHKLWAITNYYVATYLSVSYITLRNEQITCSCVYVFKIDREWEFKREWASVKP